MTLPPHGSASTAGMRALAAVDRIRALADPGSVQPVSVELETPRPSPHLTRWGIAAQDDDGIVVARASVDGATVLIAAQDERFLGGSAGANHSDALRRLFEVAAAERPAAVVVAAGSGGVRLHEANAAEWALARALSALLDLRASGIPVLVIGAADVFGGTSVLACAAERLALLPGVRLGLSGPSVIETTRGKSELHASDKGAVAAVFGADARAAAGHVELLPDTAAAAREWITQMARDSMPFARWAREMHDKLGERLVAWDEARGTDSLQPCGRPDAIPANLASLFASARPIDPAGWLARIGDGPNWLCRPIGAGTFGPREAHAVDAALLAHVAPAAARGPQALLLIGDSRGHEVSRQAEALCVSQYLAHHAAVLALLRAQGVRLHGLLAGVGHSAEFFANVLQATDLHALGDARVVAMEPAAVARVTRLPQADLQALIENDPLLGQPVRHFARFAGMDILSNADIARLGLAEDERGQVR
jgi:malonate decarboxylase beta subunit